MSTIQSLEWTERRCRAIPSSEDLRRNRKGSPLVPSYPKSLGKMNPDSDFFSDVIDNQCTGVQSQYLENLQGTEVLNFQTAKSLLPGTPVILKLSEFKNRLFPFSPSQQIC